MNGDVTNEKQSVFDVKIKSKVHPSVYHKIRVDLHCYERMPDEKILTNKKTTLPRRKKK